MFPHLRTLLQYFSCLFHCPVCDRIRVQLPDHHAAATIPMTPYFDVGAAYYTGADLAEEGSPGLLAGGGRG